MNKQTTKPKKKVIAQNKKAFHDYFIETRIEAGVVLEGWEVKSIRAGRVQLKDSYVVIKDQEAWLLGVHISPLSSASTHVTPDPTRIRKLLLHRKEIYHLQKAKDREGYTIVVTDLHWQNIHIKANVALAKGKKQYDKRETLKQRAIARDEGRKTRKIKSMSSSST